MTDVKLKKVLSRRDKNINREYWRYDVTIPVDVIERLDWEIKGDKPGTIEMDFKIEGKKLVLKKEKEVRK